MTEYEILCISCLVAFLCAIIVLCAHGYMLLRSADKRLRMANEMVLKLAASADTLSQSVADMKDMMVHLEQVYTSRNDALVKNRDEFREAYTKLLHKYERLEDKYLARYEQMDADMWNTIQEMARKPTIENKHH